MTTNQQKGFATLFVVLVLLTAMTTITVIMTRSGMLTQSISNNEGYTQEAQLAAENALEYQIAWLSTQAAQDALLVNGSIECPKDPGCPTLPTLKGKDQSEFALKLTLGGKYINVTVDANPNEIDPNKKANVSCTVQIFGAIAPYSANCIPSTIVYSPISPLLSLKLQQDLQNAINNSLALHIDWLTTHRDDIAIGSSLRCQYEIKPTEIYTGDLNEKCPRPKKPPISIVPPEPVALDVLLKPLPSPPVSSQKFIPLRVEAEQSGNNSKAVISCLVKVSGTAAPYQVARIPGTWKDWE